jgi:hypothetical protein
LTLSRKQSESERVRENECACNAIYKCRKNEDRREFHCLHNHQISKCYCQQQKLCVPIAVKAGSHNKLEVNTMTREPQHYKREYHSNKRRWFVRRSNHQKDKEYCPQMKGWLPFFDWFPRWNGSCIALCLYKQINKHSIFNIIKQNRKEKKQPRRDVVVMMGYVSDFTHPDWEGWDQRVVFQMGWNYHHKYIECFQWVLMCAKSVSWADEDHAVFEAILKRLRTHRNQKKKKINVNKMFGR